MPDSSLVAKVRFIPMVLGCLVSAAGAIVLAAWWLRGDFSDDGLGNAPMPPITAFAFLIAGLALLSACFDSGMSRGISLSLGAAVGVLGMVILVQYLLGLNARSGGIPGGSMRMSPSSAFCFILAGLALVLARSRFRIRIPVVQGIGMAILLISLIILLGYCFETLFGIGWVSYIGMAVSSAAAFSLLGPGLLLQPSVVSSTSRWALDRATTWTFVFAILFLIQALTIAFGSTSRLLKATDILAVKLETLKDIQSLFTDVYILENSQRGFIITGMESLLARRPSVEADIKSNLADLRLRVANNPAQLQRLDEWAKLIVERQTWENSTIAIRRTDPGQAASLVASGKGIAISQRLDGVLREFQKVEYQSLEAEQAASLSARNLAFLPLPLGSFLTLAMLSVGLFLLNSGLNQRNETAIQLQRITDSLPALVAQVDSNLRFRFANANYRKWLGLASGDIIGQRLSEVIDCAAFTRSETHVRAALAGQRQDYENEIRTVDGAAMAIQVVLLPDADSSGRINGVLIVALDISRRKEAEEKIILMNADLEQRVIERTAELEQANKELEAFSYSVSHDLRAPLRTIDGFSMAVIEDYGSSLPEDARRYLQTIRGGAQQMGRLIDDLLTFSRLSRLPMSRQEISMNSLVRQCMDELKDEIQDRSIEFSIVDLPPAWGDAALLKQVWINLLSNAVKYTRGRTPALIGISPFTDGDGSPGWLVRDNGAGFDMRYAHKLFGVFQRLHRSEEFEGTGVGLALVQRIILRHGGRVWCEAAVGGGASFFFTIKTQTS